MVLSNLPEKMISKISILGTQIGSKNNFFSIFIFNLFSFIDNLTIFID